MGAPSAYSDAPHCFRPPSSRRPALQIPVLSSWFTGLPTAADVRSAAPTMRPPPPRVEGSQPKVGLTRKWLSWGSSGQNTTNKSQDQKLKPQQRNINRAREKGIYLFAENSAPMLKLWHPCSLAQRWNPTKIRETAESVSSLSGGDSENFL